MIKVAVCGANGKMGQEVVKMVKETPDLQLIATIDIKDADYNSIDEACKNSEIDVLVDFTNPDSVYKNAMDCLNNGVRPVIGTTGLSAIVFWSRTRMKNFLKLLPGALIFCLIWIPTETFLFFCRGNGKSVRHWISWRDDGIPVQKFFRCSAV